MFERYTEKARRVIFFARYEASQFGSPFIESEHLLLGILREDKELSHRFLSSQATFESLRRQIEQHTTIRESIPTSVDLPLSNECKRVLAYAAEEAERLAHKHIGTEHLLLGLLREEKSSAAELLRERGVRLLTVREELGRAGHAVPFRSAAEPGSPAEWFLDLTQLAAAGQLAPAIGRQRETDALIEVLARRYENNALLIGPRGAGKSAIVEDLALRIAKGNAPTFLTKKKIVLWRSEEVRNLPRRRLDEFVRAVSGGSGPGEIIVFLDESSSEVQGTLGRMLPLSGVQCIGVLHTDSPHRDGFQSLYVKALDAQSARAVLASRKGLLESFHNVIYSDDSLAFAVDSAAQYMPEYALPGKAIALLDAAGGRAKLNRPAPPLEIQEAETRLQAMISRMESAIANHEFERARFYSDEERKEREHLQELLLKHHLAEPLALLVGIDELKDVIEHWATYPYSRESP